MTSPIDLDHARASLETSAEKLAAVLRSLPDPTRRIPNSAWTTGEAAAHIVTSLRTYGDWAVGRGTHEQLGVGRRPANAAVAEVNEQRIASIEHSDTAALADLLVSSTRTILDETKGLSADAPFEWYDGITIDLGSIAGIMLAEILIHGYDIAGAAGRPWSIEPLDAQIMMLGALALLPHYVNKETTRGVRASFDIRMRGGARIGIRLDDGAASVDLPPTGSYDCIVSADPVSLILVSYGRIGVWGPILRGKMIAFGRKPWLGMKFNTYFLKP